LERDAELERAAQALAHRERREDSRPGGAALACVPAVGQASG